MDQQQALQKLRELEGRDLRPLADIHGVTVWTLRNTLNKGWVGHTVEAVLGIPPNSSRNPDGGSWELKTTSLKRLVNGRLSVKETLAITMINPNDVARTEFLHSHLLAKLQRIIVLARVYKDPREHSAMVHRVVTFNLDDPVTYQRVKTDYEMIRQTIITKGFDKLTGHIGDLIQPRTKGPGHGSKSRAFYARKDFVKQILGI